MLEDNILSLSRYNPGGLFLRHWYRLLSLVECKKEQLAFVQQDICCTKENTEQGKMLTLRGNVEQTQAEENQHTPPNSGSLLVMNSLNITRIDLSVQCKL